MVLVMLGAEENAAEKRGVRIRQKSDVVVFFVISECVGEDEVCLAGASGPLAVPGCSAAVKLSRARGRVRPREDDLQERHLAR